MGRYVQPMELFRSAQTNDVSALWTHFCKIEARQRLALLKNTSSFCTLRTTTSCTQRLPVLLRVQDILWPISNVLVDEAEAVEYDLSGQSAGEGVFAGHIPPSLCAYTLGHTHWIHHDHAHCTV